MSWDEKLNYVKTEYNKISKSTVKDFILESGDALKVDGTNGTNICDALSEDGYEFQSDKKIKKSDINDLESAIDEISSNNVNSDSQKIIGSLSSSKGDYPILDVVSRWNTEHAGDDKSKRNIIAFITSKYNSIKDDPDNIMKDDVKKLWAAPLVNKLIDKAENLKGNKVLSTEFKNKISKAIDNLSNEFKASGMSSKLADAFDELYLYSRQASILITRNEINKYYLQQKQKLT
jgi:hypothetical protein